MECKFRPDELVNSKGKIYPVVGGRLRLAHEEHADKGLLRIETTIIKDEPSRAVVGCIVHVDTGKRTGVFHGLGTANDKKDARLKDALLEMAQTRAIARALRFAGYGYEYTGHEEISGTEPPMSLQDAMDILDIAAEGGADQFIAAWKKHSRKWRQILTEDECARLERYKDDYKRELAIQ